MFTGWSSSKPSGDVGRAPRLGELGDRQRAGVDAPDHERVHVGVREAGDLPEAEPVVVGLARRVVAERHEVGLGLEAEHRHAEVVAEGHGGSLVKAGNAVGIERRRGAASRVHEEPVEHLRDRVDVVHVRGEPERRLRLADREHPLHREVGEHGAGHAARDHAGL